MSIPNARIMTYVYDTRTQHSGAYLANRNKVNDIAWDFLVALEAERRMEPNRPVLFVAHSLGGIIVKEMLRRSRDCDLGQAHLHGIFELTAGMTFFGTPHLGIDSHDFFHHISEKLSKTVIFATDAQTISSLLPNPERLKSLASDFSSMAQEQNWMIHSFQEDYGIDALFGQKVLCTAL
jgi:predicted alpha/beta-fold hydrolase